MSSQSTPSSSHPHQGQSPPAITGDRTFTCFLELPAEIQIQVWQEAFPSSHSPRIACLEVHSTPSTALSHEVLNLNNMNAEIGWRVLNREYLDQIDDVSSLLAASHRSRTVTLQATPQSLDTPWLRRLGLTQAHIDPSLDILFFKGGDEESTETMMTMSLVLGNEFPNVMVPAMDFVEDIHADLRFGNVEPVNAALTALRAVDPVWHEIFRPGPNTLPVPRLPRNIYFFLEPGSRARRGQYGPVSDYPVLEHLEIVSWADAEAFLDGVDEEALSGQFEPDEMYMEMWFVQREIIEFWRNVEHHLNSTGTGTIPNVFFCHM